MHIDYLDFFKKLVPWFCLIALTWIREMWTLTDMGTSPKIQRVITTSLMFLHKLLYLLLDSNHRTDCTYMHIYCTYMHIKLLSEHSEHQNFLSDSSSQKFQSKNGLS